MENIKYIIFDVGGVLADPVTGHWFISNNFFDILPSLKNNIENVKIAMKNNMHLQDMRNIPNEQEEAKMFYKYYEQVLLDLNYENTNDEVLNKIVDDVVFNDNKFKFYEDVIPNLEKLYKKYKLGILSDGWASSYRVLRNNNIDKYFDTILISSVYGCVKKDGTFFEIIKNKMNIADNEAIFIDDRESVLEVSKKYGFIPVRMIRNENTINSKYTTITTLNEIDDILKEAIND